MKESKTPGNIFFQNRQIFSVLMSVYLVKISSEKENTTLEIKDLEIINISFLWDPQKARLFSTCFYLISHEDVAQNLFSQSASFFTISLTGSPRTSTTQTTNANTSNYEYFSLVLRFLL